MKLFDNKKDYRELLLKQKLRRDPDGLEDPTPMLSELPDGVYSAMRYGYTVELDDGRKFKTEYGVRNTRNHSGGYKKIQIKDGDIVTTSTHKFSGMAEVGAVLQGASYGRKPSPDENPTRIKLDTKGFKIPNGVKSVFKLKDSMYSMNSNKGMFTGGTKAPSIAISKDNSIIRDKDTAKNVLGQSSNSMENKMTNVALDWNTGKAFHLAVEPWITTPLMSDVDDGIYIGNVKGDKLDTGKQVITLSVRVTVDYPESVICLIKNQKAYIFKQSQMTASTGSRIFSNSNISRVMDEITSDEEFRSYAHNLMKEAHKDNYSKEVTDKIVTDLLTDKGKASYGELIGRLKSGLGNKKYSEIPSDINYTFEYLPSEPKFEMQALIGTLVMSIAFGHLFHLSATKYAAHMALDDYYKEMPEKVDKLAEAFLSTTKSANFQVCIIPKTMCPIQYLERLEEYVTKYQADKLSQESAFSSLIDDIVNLIRSVLYKLKRLNSGRKLFSIAEDTKLYADRSISLTRGQVALMKKQVIDAIITYVRKFKKSPIKEIKGTDDKVIKQYVNNKIVDDKSFIEIMEAVLKGVSDGITNYKR